MLQDGCTYFRYKVQNALDLNRRDVEPLGDWNVIRVSLAKARMEPT